MGQVLSRRFGSTRIQSDGENVVPIHERCPHVANLTRDVDEQTVREAAYPDLEGLLEHPALRNPLSSGHRHLGSEATPTAHFTALLESDHLPRLNRPRSRNTGTAQRMRFLIPRTPIRLPRREGRPYDGTDSSRTTLSAAASDHGDHIRIRNTSTAQSNKPHDTASQAIDGNIGTPRRQGKYVRGRSSEGGFQSTTHDRGRTHHQSGFVPTVVVGDPSKYHENNRRRQSDVSALASIMEVAHDESSQVRRKKKIGKECVICTEHRSLHRFPNRNPTKQCTHDINFCRRCLRKWIESQFYTKMWDEIGCPICHKRLEYEDMDEFAPTEVFCRYKRLSIEAACEAIPNFRWCLDKACTSGQVHDPSKPKFRCNTCKAKHCVKHGVKWHKRETCKDYDHRMEKYTKKKEEVASRNLIARTTKQCPGCKRNIEKSHGCDHMSCTICDVDFCWLCLGLYTGMQCVHRPECFYYRRFEEYVAFYPL